MTETARLTKTVVDTRHPLTKRLAKLFGGGSRTRKPVFQASNLFSHTDIVSESLCDDTIKYLAPTLEQHQGCTIIDVHPGACLWSAKIHDFLKPKRHILMEPDARYFEPFIKPLLEKPDSSYVHTHLAGAHPKSYWDSYRKLIADGTLLLTQDETPDGIPPHQSPNRNILLIGNLARTYVARRMYRAVNWEHLVLKQMTSASLTQDLFHKAGPVRMLWWVHESQMSSIYAFSKSRRTSLNVSLDVSSSITEAVGVVPFKETVAAAQTTGWDPPERPPGLEEASTRHVEASPSQKQLSLPSKRKQGAQPAESDKNVHLVSPFDDLHCTVNAVEKYLEETKRRLDQVLAILEASSRGTGPQSHIGTAMASLDFPQSLPAAKAHYYSKSGSSVEKLAMTIDIQFRIIRLEASFKLLEEQACNRDGLGQLKQRIMAVDETFQANLKSRTKILGDAVASVVEEYVSFFSDPKLLAYDRRAYERLQAQQHEFWPRTNLTLLDIVPKERDMSVAGVADAKEGVKVCQELLKHLFGYRSHSVAWALDRIAPNAGRDLIPLVPAITDPRKGGRLNPNNVRVRMLSVDAIENLTKAFLEWPFRPSTLELELEGAASEQAEEATDVVEAEK